MNDQTRIHITEKQEEEFLSFDLPSDLSNSSIPLDTAEDRNIFHDRLILRTIVAAARGGKLRRLSVNVHEAFAIRSLLPAWVSIEDWSELHGFSHRNIWLLAAGSLRPLLAHASLWLPALTPGARSDRRLTGNDVQGLQAHFKKVGMPRAVKVFQKQSLELIPYLSWLEEDATLSQQVADAWNAVVARREADLVKCLCQECKQEVGEDADACDEIRRREQHMGAA